MNDGTKSSIMTLLVLHRCRGSKFWTFSKIIKNFHDFQGQDVKDYPGAKSKSMSVAFKLNLTTVCPFFLLFLFGKLPCKKQKKSSKTFAPSSPLLMKNWHLELVHGSCFASLTLFFTYVHWVGHKTWFHSITHTIKNTSLPLID